MIDTLERSLRRQLAHAADSGNLLVAMDFDGALVDPADSRDEAGPLPGVVPALGGLSGLPGTYVAVVSGRPLADLERRTSWPTSVELIGSHGLESRSGVVVGLDSRDRARLGRIAAVAKEVAAGAHGTTVEMRPYSVVVHHRRATAEDALAVVAEVSRFARAMGDFHLQHGPFSLEISAVNANNGWGIEVLRARHSIDHVVYLGGNDSDLAAFAVLESHDTSIWVGERSRSECWQLDYPQATSDLLEDLFALRATRTLLRRPAFGVRRGVVHAWDEASVAS